MRAATQYKTSLRPCKLPRHGIPTSAPPKTNKTHRLTNQMQWNKTYAEPDALLAPKEGLSPLEIHGSTAPLAARVFVSEGRSLCHVRSLSCFRDTSQCTCSYLPTSIPIWFIDIDARMMPWLRPNSSQAHSQGHQLKATSSSQNR